MALPKRRHSKARRDKRRSHDALTPQPTSLCPECNQPKLPHRICQKCGFYNGKKVIDIKVKEAKPKQ